MINLKEEVADIYDDAKLSGKKHLLKVFLLYIIILVFILLILRGFWIALHARDRFGALLVVGCMMQISLQTFLNIAVVTGFVPATGISLPFFSYGGTALVMQLAEMGIILSISRFSSGERTIAPQAAARV